MLQWQHIHLLVQTQKQGGEKNGANGHCNWKSYQAFCKAMKSFYNLLLTSAMKEYDRSSFCCSNRQKYSGAL